MSKIKGTRKDRPDGSLPSEGEYGKNILGDWWGRPPNKAIGYICNLTEHNVIEHEDGTITVSPSILITHWTGTWHGYLEHGVWREV